MAQTAKNGPTQSELRKLVKLRIKLAIIIATKLETKQYIAPLDTLTTNGRSVIRHKCITRERLELQTCFLPLRKEVQKTQQSSSQQAQNILEAC